MKNKIKCCSIIGEKKRKSDQSRRATLAVPGRMTKIVRKMEGIYLNFNEYTTI